MLLHQHTIERADVTSRVVYRASSLAHVNTMLREQLDQATAANQQLTSDIHKLTQDWQRAREELESKEAEWREEEQVRVLMHACVRR